MVVDVVIGDASLDCMLAPLNALYGGMCSIEYVLTLLCSLVLSLVSLPLALALRRLQNVEYKK